MRREITIFLRQNVGIRGKVILVTTKLLLKFYIVEAQTVLPSYLVRAWEMVDPLVLVETFVKVSLAAATRPENVPFMRLSEGKAIGFTKAADELGVTLKDLVQHLTVVNMVARPCAYVAVGGGWWSIHQHLLFRYNLEINGIINRSFNFASRILNVLHNR